MFVVNPVTVIGDDAPLIEPGDPPSDEAHEAVNPVIAEPPSNGATKVTAIDVPRLLTVGCAGASGTVVGRADADAGEVGPLPFTFVARTLHV